MALELTVASAVSAWVGCTTAEATTLANAAEARIGNYCHRMTAGVGVGTIWLSGARTEILYGELSNGLLLKWTPVTAITSVTMILNSTQTSTYTLTDLTCDGFEIADLATYPSRVGLLRLRAGQVWDSEYIESRRARVPVPNFGTGGRRIKVVYTGGYTTPPSDLKLAATTLCKNMYDAKTRNPTLTSERLGDYAYTSGSAAEAKESEDLMGQVRDLLAPYRSYANIV